MWDSLQYSSEIFLYKSHSLTVCTVDVTGQKVDVTVQKVDLTVQKVD